MHKAQKILYHLTDLSNQETGMSSHNKKLGDQSIPVGLMRHAKAIVFISIIKTGFLLAPFGGTGIIVAKLPNGKWSGPIAVATGGFGFGVAVGMSKTDNIIILNTDFAVKAFTSKQQIKIGADIQVAAGPYGRDANAAIGFGSRGVAPAYSYSLSQGLFFGATIDGAVVTIRKGCNAKFYGRKVDALDVLTGKILPTPNPEFTKLAQFLEIVTSKDPNKMIGIRNSEIEKPKRASELEEKGSWSQSPGSASPAPAPAALPAAMAANMAPDPWESVIDETSGQVYWWNKDTNETTPIGEPKPVWNPAPAYSKPVPPPPSAVTANPSINPANPTIPVYGVDVSLDDAKKGAAFYSQNKEACDAAAKVAYKNKDTLAAVAKAGANAGAKYGQ